MSLNKYIISLTSIPSRINNIEDTIKSLIEQTLKPEKIILNIPKKYNFRFNSSIEDTNLKEILNKYIDKITINYIENDYGPGTKLLGLFKNNIIKSYSKDTFIVLVDDDLIYKPYMLEYFDNLCKNYNNNLNVSSFFCYNNNGITIGQGADGFFIKLNLLNNFEEYYNIIKDFDYINYHDDYYISYYFHLRQININYITPPYKSLIYNKQKNSNINALAMLQDKYNRNNLNNKINEILIKLNKEDKFNNIKIKTILIGPSETNTKIIKLDKTYSKNTELNFFSIYKDTFFYKFNNNMLSVTRTDEAKGWGQNLIGYL
jgi:hypothetical protein